MFSLYFGKRRLISDSPFYTKGREKQDYWRMLQVDSMATIQVKTLRTLCVLGEENVIVVDPPPP